MRLSQMNGIWKKIAQHISETTNKSIQFSHTEAISGGCISQSQKLTDLDNKHWFVKTNTRSLLGMFESEAAGLKEINLSNSIRAPKSICTGTVNEISYHVLEYIALHSQIEQCNTAKQLAKMHQTSSQRFGWHRNNTIGSTNQSNKYHDNWVSFWKTERLLFQLNLAKNKGYSKKSYEAGLDLAEKLPLFFTDYQPKPSLLHGDLWGGNCASDNDQNPVIYDPAVYFGDRETDIAMTELFGGFSSDFYAAYNTAFPLDQGYKTRKNLYNLYHILNHYNLFGGSYASQAANMTQQLLSEV